MKKALTFVLALVLVLSLAACGNSNIPSNTPSNTPSENNTTSNPPASNTPSETPIGGDEKPDASTVAGYLAQFGLTEDDIKPDGFTSFENLDGWLIKVNAAEGNANAWGKEIYNKIIAISADGKIYDQGYPTFKDEAVWSDNGAIYQWAYTYNGKTVEVDVTPPGDTATQYRVALHFQ